MNTHPRAGRKLRQRRLGHQFRAMGGTRTVRPHVHRSRLLVRCGALRGRPVQCIRLPVVALDRSGIQDRRYRTHQVLGPGFQHQLTDTTKIVDRFLVESNSDNTYMPNDLGLEVTISGSLGLRVGYQVRHKHRCTPGRGEDRYSHHRRIDLRNQVSSPP